MIPNDIQERIQYVLDKFNFEKVSLVMNVLDWTWFKPQVGGQEIPNIHRMKITARQLMERAYQELIQEDNCQVYTTGTGGFSATCSKCHNNTYDFVLQFVLTEYDSEDYE